jgi:hypothetical protein
MSEDGKLLSIDQLEAKFNISKNIMKFNSIISAVKHAGINFINKSLYNLTVPKQFLTFLTKSTKDIVFYFNFIQKFICS